MKIQIRGAQAAAAQAEIVRFFRERRGVECIRDEGEGWLRLYCPAEADVEPLFEALRARLGVELSRGS